MPFDEALAAYAVALGDRIRAAREVRGVTQAALSQRIGIDQANLRRYEKGRANITLEMLFKIARALDTDLVIDFMNRTADEGPPQSGTQEN